MVHKEDIGKPERRSGMSDRSVALPCDRSRQAAIDFLRRALDDEKGIVLLHGPEDAGKSEVIEQFVEELPKTTAIAVIDGVRLKPHGFLSGAGFEGERRARACLSVA